MKPWKLTIPRGLYAELQRHLFPGDDDEHGAVILAGTCESDRGLRLVAREIHLAKDGVDYVPGEARLSHAKGGVHPEPDSPCEGQAVGVPSHS